MLWRGIVCCLLVGAATAGSLLAHPATHLTEMSYSGPDSAEEDGLVGRDRLDFTNSAYLSQETPGYGYGYPSLFTGERNRHDLHPAGFDQDQAVKEVLMEKPVLNPLSRFLGSRRQRKRGSNTECFWKYCV